MKPGIFELAKCRASDLREALPRFNRQDTKKSMEKEILGKVGACARLQLQLQGLDEAEMVLASLKTVKDALESKYKDLKMLDDTVDEAEWQEKVKDVAKAYLLFVSKEDFAVGVARVHALKDKRLRPEAKAKNQPRKRDSPKLRQLKQRLAAKLDTWWPQDRETLSPILLEIYSEGVNRHATFGDFKKEEDSGSEAMQHRASKLLYVMVAEAALDLESHLLWLSSTLQGAGIGYTGGPSDLPARFHGDEGPGQKYKNVLVINMSFPFSHSGDTLKTRLCIACLTGQTVLTRAMQKNRIGVHHECTLDVLFRHINADLEKLTFDYGGVCGRRLCFFGLAGDQKWFQQMLQLPAPYISLLEFLPLRQPNVSLLSPRHWKGNGEANGNRSPY
ncbi:unnamed protein product [Symbiodinium sp. CCMP2592]|nr:unnamed protein product [Symbiodinium sp. CCMP2592]